MRKTAKITEICNKKGGVGKALTTASLGYQHPDQLETTLATILGHIIMDKPLSPNAGIIHHEEGIDLLPANIELSGLDVTLVNTMSRETILREYLNSVRELYDVILLDCCPSLGMLTINALAAADDVLIPMQAHFLSLKGFEQLIRTILRVKQKINPKLDIAGILITMADMRTNYSREIVKMLRDAYGKNVHFLVGFSVRNLTRIKYGGNTL